MLQRLINHYRFTRSEQRSIFILLFILMFINLLGQITGRAEKNVVETIQAEKTSGYKKENIRIQDQKVELNSADSSLLLDLYGIGPVFAGRIVKYRKLLGGFHSREQLLEVYGMDSLRYGGFEDRIYLDVSLLIRININTSSFRDLLRHPYLDYETVKKIVHYRDRNGPLSDPALLWQDSVIPAGIKWKLLPYLEY